MLVSFANAIKKPNTAIQPFIERERLCETISALQEDLDKRFRGEVVVYLETSKYLPRIVLEGTAYAEDLGYRSITTETVNNILTEVLRKHLEYDYLDIYPKFDLSVYDKDNVKITTLDIPDRMSRLNP